MVARDLLCAALGGIVHRVRDSDRQTICSAPSAACRTIDHEIFGTVGRVAYRGSIRPPHETNAMTTAAQTATRPALHSKAINTASMQSQDRIAGHLYSMVYTRGLARHAANRRAPSWPRTISVCIAQCVFDAHRWALSRDPALRPYRISDTPGLMHQLDEQMLQTFRPG